MQLISKLRSLHGIYNVGLELNEGIGGFDLYIEVEETELARKKRLIEEFADALDDYDSDEIDAYLREFTGDE